MATRNGGPATPTIKELDDLRTLVQDPDAELTNKVLDRLDNVLEWVQVFLQNRKDYHKQKNLKDKIMRDLLRGRLQDNGIDPDDIARQAAELADQRLLND